MPKTLPPQAARLVSALALLCLLIPLRAQQAFEPGYLIDASGGRSSVTIRNEDWRFHPTEIEYRRPGDRESSTVPTNSLREFGIEGKARYVNLPVLIEKSSTEHGHLPTEAPVPQTEKVLLRVEVEGKATLYSYLTPRVEKFFLSIDGKTPGQLLHTRVLVAHGRVSESNLYRQQLATHLQCGEVSAIDPELPYDLRRIKRLVQDYNDCAAGGSKMVYVNEPEGHRAFRFTILAGVSRGSYRVKSSRGGGLVADLDGQVDLRIGLDFEFIPRFGNDHFALLVRPSYQTFEANNADSQNSGEIPTSADYHALTLPVTLRHYADLTPQLKLFVSGGLGPTAHIGRTSINTTSNNKLQLFHTVELETGLRLSERWNLSARYERSGAITTINNRAVAIPGILLMAGVTL